MRPAIGFIVEFWIFWACFKLIGVPDWPELLLASATFLIAVRLAKPIFRLFSTPSQAVKE